MDRLAENNMDVVNQRIQVNSSRAAVNYLRDVQAGKIRNAPKINKNAVVTEGFLRLEVEAATKDTYRFSVLENQGTQANTETRLKVSDMFLMTHLLVGAIYAVGALNDPIERAISPIYTSNVGDLWFRLGDGVQALWNSSLEIIVDSTVYFDRYDILRFKRSGVAQKGLAASANATSNVYLESQWDDKDWGFAQLTPFIFLGGRANNQISINMPAAINYTPNSLAFVLIARGMQIQNAYSE